MPVFEFNASKIYFSSRCEQDSILSRNGTYYGSCVVGVGVGVPQRQIERETIA